MSKPNNYTPEINLSNLKDHTEQQVFDFVVAHLRKQGEQCEGLNGCAYRGYKENGDTLMCAAGCLISDDQYEEKMEDSTWSVLVIRSVVTDVYEGLISELQKVHDNPIASWEAGLAQVAEKFNLTLEPSK